MLVNTVELSNKAKILILDHIFEPDLLARLHELCDTFSPEHPDWKDPGWTKLRYEYCGQSTTRDDLCNYLSSPEFLNPVSSALGEDMKFGNLLIWVDLPGFGNLTPHVDGDDSGLMQAYITTTPHSYTGTTMYSDMDKILFQLPYRDNFGWLFQPANAVLHGREHGVPEGVKRFSIMINFLHK